MTLLFLIPARGGSKGLPGKNLSLVGGIPLVGRATRLGCAAARALGGGSRVVCSTDDPGIAEAARRWGAEVPFLRPAALASDGARLIDVVFHVLDTLDSEFDGVVLLQPTSPLTDVADVLEAIALHRRSSLPVVSVCTAEHPAEWLYTIDEAGRLTRLLHDVRPPDQRQQARVAYRANGAVYVSDPSELRRQESFFGPDTRAFVMPVARSVDVDTTLDLEIARTIVSHRDIHSISIRDRQVGPGHPCFVIAEAGVNHDGDLSRAKALVDAAAEAGADAVKFQSFVAQRIVTRDAPKAEYQVRTTGETESQFAMLERLELSEDAHRTLVEHCAARRILFLSTPFDEESSDLLDQLEVPAFKLPSGELTNLPFLRHVARKQKPIILSTGMATLEEVAGAVEAIQGEHNQQIVLLHCVSNYPAQPADANLRAIATLREAFGVPAGFSDHTLGDAVALGAVALGACVLEKHFTLDRTLPGPDHQASIEPAALREMVLRIREVEAALGHGRKEPVASEDAVARVARKSLVAARLIPAGTTIERRMLAVRRPGTGLSPDWIDALIGMRAVLDIPEGAVLTMDMLS